MVWGELSAASLSGLLLPPLPGNTATVSDGGETKA